MISRNLRYEVLRRDGFTCTYCGAKPPNATLTIDHVLPTALGGTDTPDNLKTACADCNLGKSATPPDAQLVATVAADANRWAAAIRAAAAELAAHDTSAEWFITLWMENSQFAYLPPDADQRILRMMDRGLPRKTIEDMYWVALGAAHIPARDMWAYFNGCCNKRIGQIHSRAAEIIADQDTPEGD